MCILKLIYNNNIFDLYFNMNCGAFCTALCSHGVCHPIRTLYPNKIIVSNKLLGLLGLGSGLGFGPGFILYA